MGEHARAAPTTYWLVGANLRVRPLGTLKIYKTGFHAKVLRAKVLREKLFRDHS